MTREEDFGLYNDSGTIRNKKIQDLNNRIKMINLSGANIFISIHMNMFPESKYYGAQVWYSGREESRALAHIIQEGLRADLDNGNNRLEKAANNSYKILRESDIVSVIVECGFLSNYKEEQLLQNEEYQNKIAISIAASVDRFYKEN
jgi:N-acetylmuramoyl-L-alanine amidase